MERKFVSVIKKDGVQVDILEGKSALDIAKQIDEKGYYKANGFEYPSFAEMEKESKSS